LNRLEGKVCVVTAAGQGIGRAIVEAYIREGAAKVVAIDLNGDTLRAWVSDDKIVPVVLDATDESAVAALAIKVSDATVLTNCVGLVAEGTVLDASTAELERCFRVNVSTMHLMIKHFLPHMIETSDGSIINIASVVSSIKAAPNRYVYATTKAAVLGLTKSVARDFITNGVRCNSISPGTVESPSLQERMAAKGDAAKSRSDFIARQPMGRLGTPQEIAEIAVLLASDEAKFMTGENIVIDGGMSL
tara:strand:- start:1347 stop:2087 length:741 start_codon:yes stop_codon:yes gene_type:complete